MNQIAAAIIHMQGSICATILLLHDCPGGAATIFIGSALVALSSIGIQTLKGKQSPPQ